MKIDGNRLTLDQAAMQRLDRAANDAPKTATPSRTSSGDTVQVSADAALANTAVKAVHDAPEIRTELVERMRALLASGQLGSDAGALADSLIASITEGNDTVTKK